MNDILDILFPYCVVMGNLVCLKFFKGRHYTPSWNAFIPETSLLRRHPHLRPCRQTNLFLKTTAQGSPQVNAMWNKELEVRMIDSKMSKQIVRILSEEICPMMLMDGILSPHGPFELICCHPSDRQSNLRDAFHLSWLDNNRGLSPSTSCTSSPIIILMS